MLSRFADVTALATSTGCLSITLPFSSLVHPNTIFGSIPPPPPARIVCDIPSGSNTYLLLSCLLSQTPPCNLPAICTKLPSLLNRAYCDLTIAEIAHCAPGWQTYRSPTIRPTHNQRLCCLMPNIDCHNR